MTTQINPFINGRIFFFSYVDEDMELEKEDISVNCTTIILTSTLKKAISVQFYIFIMQFSQN
jgi:hypothetical protein